MSDECPACEGTGNGAIHGLDPATCSLCNGTGKILPDKQRLNMNEPDFESRHVGDEQQRQDQDELEQQLEAVLLRVAQGETTKQDALFLCGALRIETTFLTGENNANR